PHRRSKRSVQWRRVLPRVSLSASSLGAAAVESSGGAGHSVSASVGVGPWAAHTAHSMEPSLPALRQPETNREKAEAPPRGLSLCPDERTRVGGGPLAIAIAEPPIRLGLRVLPIEVRMATPILETNETTTPQPWRQSAEPDAPAVSDATVAGEGLARTGLDWLNGLQMVLAVSLLGLSVFASPPHPMRVLLVFLAIGTSAIYLVSIKAAARSSPRRVGLV